MKLTDIRPNPNNPRAIRDARFKKLVTSIKEFPKMMALRPLVIDEDGVTIGGNMRLKALQELGYTEIPDSWVRRAEDLTPAERKRFIVADNLPFGEWDVDALANEFDIGELGEWGFDDEFLSGLWQPDEEKPDNTQKPIDVDAIQETLAWVVVSIPVKKYGQISEAVDTIAKVNGAHCEIGIADE